MRDLIVALNGGDSIIDYDIKTDMLHFIFILNMSSGKKITVSMDKSKILSRGEVFSKLGIGDWNE